MANVTMFERGNTGIAGGSGLVARMRKAIDDYRLYRRTLVELEALNARELADLGLSPFDIRQVAYESVYGG